ncbi:MAG: hypothetical protein VXY01_05065 [Bacteroidota bacterium]|nr:hypothetical protein [Bacteroidota bacterium]
MMTYSQNSILFIKNSNNIGDDRDSQHLLDKHKVASYFSGCLTLTLPHDKGDRNDVIIFVGVMRKNYTSFYKNPIANKLITLCEIFFRLTPNQSNPQKIVKKMKKFLQNFFSNT